MSTTITCPICGQDPRGKEACRHVRWTPERGGPLEFARFVIHTSPYTEGRGMTPADIPSGWWESQHDWLLERILARLAVADGYCFGEPVDLDRLCMDIWHRYAPEPERAGPRREPVA